MLGLGIAQGASNVASAHRDREFRDLQLQEARQRQRQSELQYETAKKAAPVQQAASELQLQQLQLQTQQLHQQFAKQNMFEGFRMFEADGDSRHLNQALQQLKQSPVPTSWADNLSRIDNIRDTPEARKLLQQAGIEDVEGFLADDDLRKGLVIATQSDGSQQLIDMHSVYVGTGYFDHMQDAELERENTRSLIIQRMREGNSHERLTMMERLSREMAEDQGIPVYEAYQRLQDANNRGGSATERLAREIQAQNPGMDYLEAFDEAQQRTRAGGSETERTAAQLAQESGRPYSEVLRELQAERQRTSGQKDLEAAETSRAALNEMGEGDFFSLDLTDDAVRRRALPHVTAIERLTGQGLTTEDKRTARNMRQLFRLGGTAGQDLTDAETGPIDSVLRGFREYFFDDVGSGKEAVAAYNSIRNLVRHSLFGSALTEREIAEFNRTMSSLRTQTGPILSQLKVQMGQVKEELQAIYDMNDEYVAYFYLGRSLDEVDQVVEAIDERLGMIDRTERRRRGEGAEWRVPARASDSPPARDPSQPRRSMEEIRASLNQGGN